MTYRTRLLGVVATLGLCTGADLLACGDKFLVGGRGTRYQRPKNARAASVLIYANPSSGLPAALGKLPLESVLKQQGHRSTTVQTLDQLSAVLAGGRFDVVLAANSVVAVVEKLLGGDPDAPVVVPLCVNAGQEALADGKSVPCGLKAPPKERSLLEAIESAVARHDQNARRSQIRG